jgi:hypothetical protein
MEFLAHAFSVAASIAAIAAPAAVGFGVMPRLGPGRAVVLALSSRFFSRAAVASARVADVATLRAMIDASRRGQYVVVAGPKGVGKTCVVESATEATCGVVTVRVPAGTREKEILSDVFTALTRYYVRALDQSGSARRVLWWHALLFRVPATVVLQAAERKPAQDFADLESAARALAADYGARVVIDASNNSLPDAARATLREQVLDVEPMPRATLEALPELAPLLASLRAAGMADVVWASVGGVPAAYLKLDGAWAAAGRGADAAPVATALVEDLLARAVGNVGDAVAADARLPPLFALFGPGGSAAVRYSALRDLGVVRASPDKVLRAVSRRDGGGGGGAERTRRVLVPADAAAALALRFALTEAPAARELAAMLR